MMALQSFLGREAQPWPNPQNVHVPAATYSATAPPDYVGISMQPPQPSAAAAAAAMLAAGKKPNV